MLFSKGLRNSYFEELLKECGDDAERQHGQNEANKFSLARMDAYGTSWVAVVISREDLMSLLSGEADLLTTALAVLGVLCVVAGMIGGGVFFVRWVGRRMARERDLEAHAKAATEMCNYAVSEYQRIARHKAVYETAITGEIPKVVDTILHLAAQRIMTPEKAMLGNDHDRQSSPAMTPALTSGMTPKITYHDGQARRQRKPRKTPVMTGSKNQGSYDSASLGDVAQWAEDSAAMTPGEKIQSTPLHEAYEGWCHARGKTPVNQYAFGLAMKEMRWTKANIGGKIYYLDISLKQPALKVVQG